MEVSVIQEIAQIQMGKPHVVILGAGASRAAFPKGDKNGLRLPLMDDFVEVLGLEHLLCQTGIDFNTVNFEKVYDQLYQKGTYQEIIDELEKVIYGYFSRLEITDEPTIYDHLLLSMREKDIVATFNWDPFLLQAYRRNAQEFKLPKLLFLHGNVDIGYCENDKVMGVNGNKCTKCDIGFTPTKLLYPISEKNYHLNSFISSQWQELSKHLKNAFMITIFGYGAPRSDASAIDLMKSAWGGVNKKVMAQTEIIDKRSEDDLCDTWEPFIHSHHYEIHSSFYESWIANHPRRTGEAYINQYWNAQFITNNPIPEKFSFTDLWAWFKPLKQVENGNKNT